MNKTDLRPSCSKINCNHFILQPPKASTQSISNMPTNNPCWTERVYQITQGIVIAIIIILVSIELWVLFGRESRANRVIKDVIVTLESETTTTTESIECSLPELLNDGICNNEIRMEANCMFDHHDCKFNPKREAIAQQICIIIQSKSPDGILNCNTEVHKKYPWVGSSIVLCFV